MNKISVIGLDLAKNVFQVHGIDTDDEVVVRKQLRRIRNTQVFCQAGAVSDWHGGLRRRTLLVAGVDPVGAYRSDDGAGLCQTVPEVQQERPQ